MNPSRLDFHRFWANLTTIVVAVASGQIVFLQTQYYKGVLDPTCFLIVAFFATTTLFALRYFHGLRRRLLSAEQKLERTKDIGTDWWRGKTE